MRHLDLFSGIGGFALAARWMGWQTVGFCEIEEFPRKILAKNFPGIPIFDDVRTLDADRLALLGRIDIVTGGFPCQDVSTAGKRAGLAGSRSGLWAEMFRVICAAQPAWVVAENVPGLRTIGADRVLADLAEAGYTAWPLVVGAVHAGAPHRRQRVWIVANAGGERSQRIFCGTPETISTGRGNREHADMDGSSRPGGWGDVLVRASSDGFFGMLLSCCGRMGHRPIRATSAWLQAESGICGVAHGIPNRVDRIRALGNAIVPQVAYYLFRAIEDAVNGRD